MYGNILELEMVMKTWLYGRYKGMRHDRIWWGYCRRFTVLVKLESAMRTRLEVRDMMGVR